MQKIEFRLIRNGQIVGYERHIKDDDGLMIIEHSDGVESDCDWFEIDKFGYLKHDDKEQYTTVKDKTDQKIFEGDIIRFNPLQYGTVVFINGAFYLDDDGFLLSEYGENIEIIGNKWKNKDLLGD